MTSHPVLNALLAALYISGVAGLLSLGELFLKDTPDTFLIPIAMLSLFVLSAIAVPTLLFFRPVVFYLDGHRKEAIALAARTVAAFAIVTLCIFAGMFLPVLL